MPKWRGASVTFDNSLYDSTVSKTFEVFTDILKLLKSKSLYSDFLKSISKKSLNKSQTAEFLNNYAITLEDERNQGVVTYIFDEKNYKRYQDGKVISEDGWRFTNLGRLRVFSGDIKLTWKFKLDKQNVIVIKTKFQPLGKEYPFTYQLKDKFFDQIN